MEKVAARGAQPLVNTIVARETAAQRRGIHLLDAELAQPEREVVAEEELMFEHQHREAALVPGEAGVDRGIAQLERERAVVVALREEGFEECYFLPFFDFLPPEDLLLLLLLLLPPPLDADVFEEVVAAVFADVPDDFGLPPFPFPFPFLLLIIRTGVPPRARVSATSNCLAHDRWIVTTTMSLPEVDVAMGEPP